VSEFHRWLLVATALASGYVLARRLFRGAMREADTHRRALGRGQLYDAFLADHGRLVAGACVLLALVDGGLAPGARFGTAVRDGAACALVAWCVLLLWVDAKLARAFRAAADPPRLMSDGPYALVRHPRYLCWLGVLGSLAVVADSPLGLAATGGFGALVLRRIAREERFLRRLYGEAYASYAARTKRLIPWVY
jgi:protein-S-isoprenylcysteine O-methyltransferase Ste14